ncbi:MAG: hypothetical protein NC218_11610 [Acetobacter sp.]|nr:hypothetical protein [Acetobacter sp.]
MSKKKETLLEHWLYMWFSAAYRQQMALERGEEVWRELDKELPRAVGVLEDDELRMALFAKKIPTISSKDKACLVQWLEHQLYELEHNFCEHITNSIEEWERKWKQIYRTHLEVIN